MMFRDPDSVPPQPGWPFKLNPKFPRLDKMNIKVADGNTSFIPRRTGDGKKKLLQNSFNTSVSRRKSIHENYVVLLTLA